VEELRGRSNHPEAITAEQRQAIDALLRRLAQRLEGAFRDLSPRPQPFSHTTLELRQSHLAHILEEIVTTASDPSADSYPAGKRARIREHVQFVYQFLFTGLWSLSATQTFLIPEDFELDPMCELLHDVRLRLTDPSDLLTIEQAAELLGIQRPMAYQWIDEGILHPLRVGPHKYRRCERWEIDLVLRERGRADQVPLHVSDES
jgi:excisionase family DNA binding protein